MAARSLVTSRSKIADIVLLMSGAGADVLRSLVLTLPDKPAHTTASRSQMNLLLKLLFVAASAVMWVGVAHLSIRLARSVRGTAARELATSREIPVGVILQGALLFVCGLVAAATITRSLGSALLRADIVLYAAVFGGSAAVLAFWADARPVRERGGARKALLSLSWFVPVTAGVLAGVLGPV